MNYRRGLVRHARAAADSEDGAKCAVIAALPDEYFDSVQDALQAELEGVIGIGDGLVVLAGRGADPRGYGVALGVEDFGEPGSGCRPPGRVVDPGAALDVEGVDRTTSGTADVAVDESDDGVHLQIVEAEPVDGPQLTLVLGDDSWAQRRAGGGVEVPIGVLTVVTGVAGSGKSTLVTDGLLAQHAGVIIIDQSPVATSIRSPPATAGLLTYSCPAPMPPVSRVWRARRAVTRCASFERMFEHGTLVAWEAGVIDSLTARAITETSYPHPPPGDDPSPF